MCKTKTRSDAAQPLPIAAHRHRHRRSSSSTTTSTGTLPSAHTAASSATNPASSASASATATASATASSSTSSTSSLPRLRDSLPTKNPPLIYPFPEISAATNNFLAPRLGGASWRCSLRRADAVIVQRRLRRALSPSDLSRRLFLLAKSHHSSLAPLLGASLSGDYIYLVYEYAPGASLSVVLRNPNNPSFTVLNTWLTRIRVAADLSAALSYIHHYSGLPGLVHNHITPSSVIISDPDLSAKICLYGAAQLAGEVPDDTGENRTDSVDRSVRVDGTRGYMAPEIIDGGWPTQKSDVYAFGVVVLELISGEEAVRYRYDRDRGEYERVSVVEMARAAAAGEGVGWVRRWVDRRLKDSFPEEVAAAMTRIAVECAGAVAEKRPDMRRVAGKLEKMRLASINWAGRLHPPTDFSVSLAGR